MTKYRKLIDYTLIKSKNDFNLLLEKREKGESICIDINYFNIDTIFYNDFQKNLIAYEEIIEKSIEKDAQNVTSLLQYLKEYFAVRDIITTPKRDTVETSSFVYRLF